jgi:hypothetical protein
MKPRIIWKDGISCRRCFLYHEPEIIFAHISTEGEIVSHSIYEFNDSDKMRLGRMDKTRQGIVDYLHTQWGLYFDNGDYREPDI